MEGSENHGEARYVDVVSVRVYTHEAANHVNEGIEAAQHPDNAENVKRKVGEGGTSSLRVGSHGSDVGSDGGSDVLTEHEGYTHIDGEHAGRAEHHGNGHESR